jgi:hypothetical protein
LRRFLVINREDSMRAVHLSRCGKLFLSLVAVLALIPFSGCGKRKAFKDIGPEDGKKAADGFRPRGINAATKGGDEKKGDEKKGDGKPITDQDELPPDRTRATGGGGQGGKTGDDTPEEMDTRQDSSGLRVPRPLPSGKNEKRTPRVWHRDRRRPSFARVYVGNGNSLDLVSLQVTVTVEGPRARTVVDHIFHNPHNQQLEGTFEYPLPTGASPSYYAMFIGRSRDAVPSRFRPRGEAPALPPAALAQMTPAQLVKQVNSADWGDLREGRVVANDRALETYEEIVRGRIDPALLQYAGGNTFRGRVFPIPPRGYNRVLIAYEELLPASAAGVQYRFPLPDCKLTELLFTLQMNASEGRNIRFHPSGTRVAEGGGKRTWTRTWRDRGPGGEVRCAFDPPSTRVQAVSGRQGENGPVYLYARVRPQLETRAARPFAEHAVFLLDTSLSEQPDRFAVNMKLLRQILQSDPDIKHFNILTFDVAGRWVEPKGWLANTPEGRATAWSRLDGVVLEGATDLSAALDRLIRPGFEVPSGTPLNVFLLSDGQITWGEPDAAALVVRFEARCPYPTRFHCYRIGIGAENQEVFEALTRRGGGVFHCHGEDELAAAARAHRSQCLQVERIRFVGGPAVSEVLVAGRKSAVYPGGELIVAGQVNGTGRVQLVLEGTFLGKKVVEEFPIEVNGAGELAARGWGEVAVAALLSLNNPRLDDVVTAYCQQFGIASRVASFLVLENDADYKRLNLQAERGRTLPEGDVGRFVEEAWKTMAQVQSPRQTWEQFLAKVAPRVRLWDGADGQQAKRLYDLLADADFEMPDAVLGGGILRRADVPPAYLAARDQDRRAAGVYLAEARRRGDQGDVGGAVRALSSVVEVHPGRADALRLVGYRLLDLKQPGHAVQLFRRVQQQRPFEPHSYRDLARSLEESRRFGLAALQYEVVLAGTWHNRFGEAIKQVVREEYAQMLVQANRARDVRPALARYFAVRLQRLTATLPPSDLRVTISWNTDATDVDLWVIEPDGSKCFYGHNRTSSGGELSQDQTQGYGPERYQIARAAKGVYQIIVHYFAMNPNLLAGETHVNVVVTRHAGTPRERSERHTVILKRRDEQVLVCKVKF